MSANRSKDRSFVCSFTLAGGRHCRTSECDAITLRVLCAPVSVASMVNLFPRSRLSLSANRPQSLRSNPWLSSGHRLPAADGLHFTQRNEGPCRK
jgi:hypothetical protein